MQSALKHLEIERTPEQAGVERTSGVATVETIAPRIETHWTRFLYADLFDAERD